MRKIIVGLSLSFLGSCTSEQETPYNAETITPIIVKGTDSTISRSKSNGLVTGTITLYGSAELKTIIKYDQSQKLPIWIHSLFIGKNYGHNFEFDSKGRLKLYCYYIGQDKYTRYDRYFDSTGKTIEENGFVLVDWIADREKKYIDFFFTSVFHNNITANISTPSVHLERINLKSSTMQPMLLEGRFNFKNDSVFYLETLGIDKITKQRTIFRDTIQIDLQRG